MSNLLIFAKGQGQCVEGRMRKRQREMGEVRDEYMPKSLNIYPRRFKEYIFRESIHNSKKCVYGPSFSARIHAGCKYPLRSPIGAIGSKRQVNI